MLCIGSCHYYVLYIVLEFIRPITCKGLLQGLALYPFQKPLLWSLLWYDVSTCKLLCYDKIGNDKKIAVSLQDKSQTYLV